MNTTSGARRKPPTPVPPCPDCGGELALKSGQYGVFYSCTKYPSCKGQHPADKSGLPLGVPPTDTPTREARKTLRTALDSMVAQLGGDDAAGEVVRLWLDKGAGRKGVKVWDIDAPDCLRIIERASMAVVEALRPAVAKRR